MVGVIVNVLVGGVVCPRFVICCLLFVAVAVQCWCCLSVSVFWLSEIVVICCVALMFGVALLIAVVCCCDLK